jgi:hypothetical protein
LRNVTFNGEKYAKLEHEAQYLESVWHKRVCKPDQGCAEAVGVPCNKLCNRAELEFVGPRVHSLSKCSLHITWKTLITICADSRQARENDFAVSLAVVEGDTEL